MVIGLFEIDLGLARWVGQQDEDSADRSAERLAVTLRNEVLG